MISAAVITQIAILYIVIYAILKSAWGSRFGQALMGVGIIAALLCGISFLFRFDVISQIVKYTLIYLAISTVVIFQPEIRRFLATVGAFGYLNRPRHTAEGAVTAETFVEIVMDLAETRTGALFAFERGISLRSYEDDGVSVDALFSRELARSVFTPPLPLHDGGAIIRHGRLAAAHCLFPVSNSPALIAHGMRHRAAVGLSEETDALVIVVSEETGSVSVARNGRLTRYTGDQRRAALLRWVRRALPADAREGGFPHTLLARLIPHGPDDEHEQAKPAAGPEQEHPA